MYRKLERFRLCNHAGALGAASSHRLAANRLYGDTDAADAGFVIPRVAGLVRVAAQGARRCLYGILHLGRGHAVVELADEDLTGDGARDIGFRRVGRLGEGRYLERRQRAESECREDQRVYGLHGSLPLAYFELRETDRGTFCQSMQADGVEAMQADG